MDEIPSVSFPEFVIVNDVSVDSPILTMFKVIVVVSTVKIGVPTTNPETSTVSGPAASLLVMTSVPRVLPIYCAVNRIVSCNMVPG